MKNFMAFAIASLCINGAQASAQLFDTYATVGKKVVTDLQSKGTTTSAELNQLVSIGYQIMDLYIVKYPECKAQFKVVKADDQFMRSTTFQVLSDKYHDGTGLEAAPTHCYQARSMVVHVHMCAALLREGGKDADVEIDEVVRRAPKIKKVLGF